MTWDHLDPDVAHFVGGSLTPGGSDGPYSYGRARAIFGSLCIVVGLALVLLDSIRAIHTVDSIVLGLIFGTGTVLLGVEAVRRRIGD